MLDNPFTKVLQEGIARRRFLRGTGCGAAGLAAAFAGSAIAAPRTKAKARPAGLTDADIFNFALNFEYLGAEYYLGALGTSLPGNLTGGGGPVTTPGTGPVPFQNTAIAYFAQQLAVDEYAHVTVIQEALTAEGATPISEPAIDLDASWTSLAVAAGLIADGETFNPYASETDFLLGAYVLEDVCVTALCGAAALISSKINLAYAASILGVEGYQVGMIRQRLSAIGAGAATDAISALRSALSNAIVDSGVDDYGTDANGNPYNFTNVDFNGQAFRRTPQQVLNIAYGGPGPGATSGGFFPNGVNGTITTT
jgi:hypothetical protein